MTGIGPVQKKAFRQAIKLNPGSKAAHHEYGEFLFRLGKTEEGLAEMKRAQESDPLSEATNANLANAYIFNREYDKALEHCKKTLTFFPNSGITHSMLGQAYFFNGMYEQAIRTFKAEVTASAGISPVRFGFLGSAYALSGNRDKAFKVLEEARQDTSIFGIAMICTNLGEKDEALTLLEQAYDARNPFLIGFIRNPIFDPLNSEPRFQALLNKIRL